MSDRIRLITDNLDADCIRKSHVSKVENALPIWGIDSGGQQTDKHHACCYVRVLGEEKPKRYYGDHEEIARQIFGDEPAQDPEFADPGPLPALWMARRKFQGAMSYKIIVAAVTEHTITYEIVNSLCDENLRVHIAREELELIERLDP